MNLVIDIGNSLVKAAVFQDNTIIEKRELSKDNFRKELINFIKLNPEVRFGIICSVLGDMHEKVDFLNNYMKVFIVGLDTSLAFKNLYENPENLGADRKALISAAVKLYKGQNTLVIDAGTCITYDFKNAKEEYLGGGISPGLQMRLKALHKFTAKLPLIKACNLYPEVIGNSTESSILSGVVNGILAEIDGIIDKYRHRFEDLTIIMTGGDARFLSIRLKNSIFANSNFLLEGLNYILEFNKTQ